MANSTKYRILRWKVITGPSVSPIQTYDLIETSEDLRIRGMNDKGQFIDQYNNLIKSNKWIRR